MRDVLDSILGAIGNTPMVKLKMRWNASSAREVLVKLESLNPTGSLKDRIYKEMLVSAVENGELKPGMEILEASTGNAGIACAFVGKILGYPVTVVMPEGMSKERKQLIKALGGKLILTPGGESDVDLCILKIERMMNEEPEKYYFPAEFSNEDNPAAHYRSTAPEIWTQTDGKIDCFIAAQGTGGTITGVGRYLRERNRSIRLYTVEPAEAPILSHARWGVHKIEGIGDGLLPKNLDLSILTGVVTVSSDEAVAMTRRLLNEEGIFCGISSGCNVAAAFKIAERHPELKRIVTLINDSGDRYLSTEVFGHKRELKILPRDHHLDERTLKQLEKYQRKLEIIE